MRSMILRSGVLAIAILLAGVNVAAADTSMISRGEADMILKGDGVGTIVGHGGTPAVDSGFGIRPYFDPASYCVLDWHVLLEGWFELAIEKPNVDCDRCLKKAYVDPVYYSVEDLRAAIEAVVFTL